MNQLKVKQQEAIMALHERGWSKRRIARELALDRVTVRRYIAAAKSPALQTGSGDAADSKSPGVQAGSQGSSCVPWRTDIERGFEAGLSVQRIFEDLVGGT
jgi:hypothetical protein